MNYYQGYSAYFTAKANAMNDYQIITDLIGCDMFSKNPKYKELWFLYDTPFSRGYEWITKACTTILYHEIKFKDEDSTLDRLLIAKRQMKEDRKNGLKLW